MKWLLLLMGVATSALVFGAEVQWDCFDIVDYDWGGGGHSLQYTLGYSPYPEAGFRVSNGTGSTRTLTFTGDYSNCGDNATFWAKAAANTILDADWVDQTTPLLDMGFGGEYKGDGTLTIYSPLSAYIAFAGRTLGDNDYYTGWIKIKNNKGEIEIVSSALAIGSALAVGTGDTYSFSTTPTPTPEPSSGLLLLLGLAAFSLKRK